MKTKLYLLACLAYFSLTATAYSGPTILLHHKGKVIVFETDTLQPVIDAAVDGDTIYLTKGVFFSGKEAEEAVEINKSITLKGASGEQTFIKASLNINPRKGRSVDNYKVTIEGICFVPYWIDYENDKRSNINVSNVILRNCRFECECAFAIENENNISNIEIDKCRIGFNNKGNSWYNYGLLLSRRVKNIKLSNSLVFCIKYNEADFENGDWVGEGIRGEFVNCYVIPSMDMRTFLPSTLTFINCILGNESGHVESTLPTYINTLAPFPDWVNYNYKINSYTTLNTDNYVVIDTSDKMWDVDFLTENGFLGNDGTVVGPMGGKHPFTLEPELPVVTESSTKLDLANKKFNVNLTVSPKP